MITALRNGEAIATGQDELATMVDEYYTSLFGEATQRDHTIDLAALSLPSLDIQHLETPFSEEGVEKVVKGMPLDKAPGPDDFTCKFYATCWPIIKDDIMRAVDMFYRGDVCGLPAINKEIVSLLPKIVGALDLKDFSPVILIHGAVKIFEKTLANRLAAELPTLVQNHQSAFVKGRSIHANFMLVQCTARHLHAL